MYNFRLEMYLFVRIHPRSWYIIGHSTHSTSNSGFSKTEIKSFDDSEQVFLIVDNPLKDVSLSQGGCKTCYPIFQIQELPCKPCWLSHNELTTHVISATRPNQIHYYQVTIESPEICKSPGT